MSVPLVARRQFGVFTAAQAEAEGLSERIVRRRLEQGSWNRVAGVGLSSGTKPWSPEQLATAAQLTLPGAVVSHRTAGLLHDFPLDPGEECDVILPLPRRASRGIRPHFVRVDEREVWRGPGYRLTSRLRTGVDLLAGLPFGEALDLWAWLSTRRVVTRDELSQAAKARVQWHGTPQLRRLLDLTVTGAVSHAEFELHQILFRAGIDGWVANAPVSDRRGIIGNVDVLFEKAKVVIEVDGYRAHSERATFQRDRARQNRLVAAGYTVLRFTWHDLTVTPAQVVRTLRGLI